MRSAVPPYACFIDHTRRSSFNAIIVSALLFRRTRARS
jgi:hypothetical protein